MKGRAIFIAYVDTGALNVSCGHCGAEPGDTCTKPDGRISKVPCVDRIAAADLAPSISSTPVDFSEPRRPQEAS